MKTAIAALVLHLPMVSVASSISMGSVELEVPNPPGFAPVTPNMTALYEYQRHFVAPKNTQFIVLIPEETVPTAMRGEIPELSRWFVVQTPKTLVDASVSNADFIRLKETIKSQNADLVKKAERAMPKLTAQFNKGIMDKYSVNLAFSISQMVTLPVHMETDRTIAFSAFTKYTMNDSSGGPADHIVASTMTIAHVKGKILFLYCYADQAGLAWSRDVSRQWASTVMDVNPPDTRSSIEEAVPSSVSSIDWAEVGPKAIAGGLIGLLFGGIGLARRRSKAR